MLSSDDFDSPWLFEEFDELEPVFSSSFVVFVVVLLEVELLLLEDADAAALNCCPLLVAEAKNAPIASPLAY